MSGSLCALHGHTDIERSVRQRLLRRVRHVLHRQLAAEHVQRLQVHCRYLLQLDDDYLSISIYMYVMYSYLMSMYCMNACCRL